MEEVILRILAIDDRDPGLIISSIKEAGAFDVFAPSHDDPKKKQLIELLRELFDATKSAFNGSPELAQTPSFKDYDLLILDFGLTTLPGFDVRLTAEHVAGYIRALTDVPYVVSLNKLGEVDFDLKYLLGDFETKADLALNTKLLGIPGLWSGETKAGEFCPWYWPRLNEAARRRRAQIGFIKENLDQPILQSLGFPEEVIEQLSLQAIAFLSPDAEDGEEGGLRNVRDVTFWQHFRSSNRTLIRDDRRGLFGGPDGVIPPTAPGSEDIRTIASRVVAGELDFWFRRDILGPQRLLIDTPHLQGKYKFRPGEGEKASPETWTATAKELKQPFGLANEFYDIIAEFQFKQIYGGVDFVWTDKPSFWLPQIEYQHQFVEFAENHPKRQNDLVFCEDTRRFLNQKETKVHRFETALGRGIDVRYIEKIEPFDYSPRSQLAR